MFRITQRGISGCRKKRFNTGTFFWQPL